MCVYQLYNIWSSLGLGLGISLGIGLGLEVLAIFRAVWNMSYLEGFKMEHVIN